MIRIVRAPKNAMQSGVLASQTWQVIFPPHGPSLPGEVMGWPVMSDTQSEVRLNFSTLEEATAYVEQYCQAQDYSGGFSVVLESPEAHLQPQAPADHVASRLAPKSYGDNYRHGAPIYGRTAPSSSQAKAKARPHIALYTKPHCPYCVKATHFLQNKGYDVELIDIQAHPHHRDQMLELSGGRKTVPQIFINGTHVGGCDDLMALDRAGKLDALLGR